MGKLRTHPKRVQDHKGDLMTKLAEVQRKLEAIRLARNLHR